MVGVRVQMLFMFRQVPILMQRLHGIIDERKASVAAEKVPARPFSQFGRTGSADSSSKTSSDPVISNDILNSIPSSAIPASRGMAAG